MASPNPPGSSTSQGIRSFSLKALFKVGTVRFDRITHWVAGALTVVPVGLLSYSVLRNSPSYLFSPGRIPVLAFGVFFAAACAYLFVGTIPQAESLEVSDNGVRLIARSGKSMREIRWDDPRLSLVLDWTESNPLQTSRGLPAIGQLKGNVPFNTYLTREAFQAIVRAAQARKLAVAEGPAPGRPGWSRTTIRAVA